MKDGERKHGNNPDRNISRTNRSSIKYLPKHLPLTVKQKANESTLEQMQKDLVLHYISLHNHTILISKYSIFPYAT